MACHAHVVRVAGLHTTVTLEGTDTDDELRRCSRCLPVTSVGGAGEDTGREEPDENSRGGQDPSDRSTRSTISRAIGVRHRVDEPADERRRRGPQAW
jgi:hypothetical protein